MIGFSCLARYASSCLSAASASELKVKEMPAVKDSKSLYGVDAVVLLQALTGEAEYTVRERFRSLSQRLTGLHKPARAHRKPQQFYLQTSGGLSQLLEAAQERTTLQSKSTPAAASSFVSASWGLQVNRICGRCEGKNCCQARGKQC